MTDQLRKPRWLGIDMAAGSDTDTRSRYVLREKLASRRRGIPVYFEQMTRIGPCNTTDPRKAHIFAHRDQAAGSKAMRHWLSDYVIEPAPALPGDADQDKAVQS